MAQVADRETHVPVRAKPRARAAMKWVFGAILLGAIGVGAYIFWQRLAAVESTDDAQIDGTIVPVSARVGGYVTNVFAGDEQYVKQGETLIQLDQRDYKIALARAQADLANAEAGLLGARGAVPVTSVATTSAMSGARSGRDDAAAAVSRAEQQLAAERARLTAAEANVRAAEANRNKTAQDAARYKVLVDKDEVSRQSYDQAAAAVQAAQAVVDAQQAAVAESRENVAAAEKSVDQARAKLQQAEASVEAASIGPAQVKLAEVNIAVASSLIAQKKADVDQAQLNLSYTTIQAPVDGVVGRKAVDPGQNVAPGQQLMSIVNLTDIWVTANFKETQLRQMKIGQKADIEVDATGRVYRGTVERIAGASGARFSLLPPENASGNYVKVVQRIPVRIALAAGQNDDHALRPGMSVTPKVHIR